MGQGELHKKLKNAEPLLTEKEVKKGEDIAFIYPTENDILDEVPLVTPSKLNIGPGHSKKIAESQKQKLKTTKLVQSNEIISIDIESPVQKKKSQVQGNKRKVIGRLREQLFLSGIKSLSLKRTPEGPEGAKKTGKKALRTAKTLTYQHKRIETTDIADNDLLEGLEPISDDDDAENTDGNIDNFNKSPVLNYEQIREENMRKNMEFLQNMNFIQTLKQTKKPELKTPDYLVKGTWTIVAFEDTWYPGVVEEININTDTITVNFMHPCNSQKEKFKWPTKADKTVVNSKFVIFVTLPPFSTNGGRMYQFYGTECIQSTYTKFQMKYFK